MITEEGLSQRALGNPTINNWGEELAKSLGIGTKWESGVSGKQRERRRLMCSTDRPRHTGEPDSNPGAFWILLPSERWTCSGCLAIHPDLPAPRSVNYTTFSRKLIFTVRQVVFPSAILDILSALSGSRTWLFGVLWPLAHSSPPLGYFNRPWPTCLKLSFVSLSVWV